MALHIQGSVAALVFVVLFCSAVVVSSQCDNRPGVDETLRRGATGENVVTTAANRIRNSGIFGDDHQFLRRMAKVESDNGESIGSGMGGIWRVDTKKFRKVNEYLLHENPCSHHQEDPCLQEQLEMLCIDLDVINREDYEELDAPLYSALYVMIYLVETLRRTIPDTIEAQAMLWKADLNSAGSEEHFIMIARQLQGIYSQCLDTQNKGNMKMSFSIQRWLNNNVKY